MKLIYFKTVLSLILVLFLFSCKDTFEEEVNNESFIFIWVIDGNTNQAITEASVFVYDSFESYSNQTNPIYCGTTNIDGQFLIRDVAPGSYYQVVMDETRSNFSEFGFGNYFETDPGIVTERRINLY